ncbi:hypothetical protein KDH83_13055 [Achromobacter sp. Marseille-Q0513]|uniref:hypothetical protein n=1 Tax=Achromobacter sp. Marseille-Q0513 TaxID=2829161 RepID=UPI001BA26A2C|nr:hypothetical protein [Achromobacter sp. Marseille-Q0513]MBR8654223.1 hypothetical protein [Achromobacter sp. Marseille-Q0513]
MVMAQTSVDCGARSTPVVDRLVCNSPSLLALDAKFGRAYAAARDANADKKAFLARAQADLAWRQQNCRDSACIEEWFNNVTPQYSALAASGRAYGVQPVESKRATTTRDGQNGSQQFNLAIGQCAVVRGMVSGVPTWRDNGVPMERAWFNVASALSPFAPNAALMQQWEHAVAQIYSSSLSPAEVGARYESMCDQYQSLDIPAPRPR